MANEVTVVNEWGEAYTLDMLRDKKTVENMSAESLHDLAYAIKSLKAPMKNVEEAVKSKLDEGAEIKGISYTNYEKKTVTKPSNKKLRELVLKYGWDVVTLKTPKQLQDRFGEDIKKDLEDIVVYETQKRVKYE